MWNLFGVMVFHRFIVNWSGGYMYSQYMCILLYVNLFGVMVFRYLWSIGVGVDVSSVYVHSAICDTYLVSWYSIDLLSIGVVGYMYPQYMCILLYVIVIWCNGISEIYCQLEWGATCILSICAFCYMWHLFGVMVFHRSIVNWSGGYVYPQYMCILWYV